ncbi:uncharacterized protein LOC110973413 [Acanthaster planci]|uniref:Uncharacterized protein LOC110973413 n=1 Tax=Acanthaster planci TaxID=133434 RepID=A0A8B7XGL8_ACAPL|nr:uncharacterized protein LOC110973413 [Acanthaster planci]
MDVHILIMLFPLFNHAMCQLTAVPVTNKPAWLSTTLSAEYAAGKAVDNDLRTIAHNGADDAHPVLGIDLEEKHCLGRITVTLRDSGCGSEPCFMGTVVRAGLSSHYADNQPCGLPATTEQSSAGAVNQFLCETPRLSRYVTLDIDRSQFGLTDPTLKIAEIQVEEYSAEVCAADNGINCLSGTKPALFIQHEQGLIGNPDPLSIKRAPSLTYCALYCLKREGCFFLAFSPVLGLCSLHNQTSESILVTIRPDFIVYARNNG